MSKYFADSKYYYDNETHSKESINKNRRFLEEFGFDVTDVKLHRRMDVSYASYQSVSEPYAKTIQNETIYDGVYDVRCNDRVVDRLRMTQSNANHYNDLYHDLSRRHSELVEKRDAFKEILYKNPTIKESYDEFMVLCKLAGLSKPWL